MSSWHCWGQEVEALDHSSSASEGTIEVASVKGVAAGNTILGFGTNDCSRSAELTIPGYTILDDVSDATNAQRLFCFYRECLDGGDVTATIRWSASVGAPGICLIEVHEIGAIVYELFAKPERLQGLTQLLLSYKTAPDLGRRLKSWLGLPEGAAPEKAAPAQPAARSADTIPSKPGQVLCVTGHLIAPGDLALCNEHYAFPRDLAHGTADQERAYLEGFHAALRMLSLGNNSCN